MNTQSCPECDFPGDGACPACHGKGVIPSDELSLSGPSLGDTPCPTCGGGGECRRCGGTGEIEVGGEG
jgi:hypothetical protein